MKLYTTKEVIYLTGISEHTLKDILRKDGFRGPRFIPDVPTDKRGKPSYFSDRDVMVIKEYVLLRKQAKEIEIKTKELLKTKNI